MYVRSKFASSWLDAPEEPGAQSHPQLAAPSRPRAVTRFAVRPLETPAGRCIALKQVLQEGRDPRLFVLFESRYMRTPEPVWVPAERVLDPAQAARWAEEGFRR